MSIVAQNGPVVQGPRRRPLGSRCLPGSSGSSASSPRARRDRDNSQDRGRDWRSTPHWKESTTPYGMRSERNPVVPFAVAAAVSIAAYRARALSADGALASTAVGAAVLSGAGVLGATALTAFFASSTALGRLPRANGSPQRRGNERDAVQVLANGGVAAVLAVAMTSQSSRAHPLLLAGFGGALAAAAADTWATEIGARASARPRSILTGRPVPVGTSGGVSLAGLLASAAGGAFVAMAVAASARHGKTPVPPPLPAVALGGICGALADSILGASVQEVRYCESCGEETESLRHRCGHPTTVVRGIPGFDNDVVNLAATLVGATTAAMIARSTPTHAAAAER